MLKFNDPYGADRVLLARTSALFALTGGATAPERVIDELRQYDFDHLDQPARGAGEQIARGFGPE